MKQIISTIFLILNIFFGFSQSVQQPESKAAEHIKFLAEDNLKGRFPGTEGESDAAKYILEQLISAGCRPLFEDGFQTFPFYPRSVSDGAVPVEMKGRNVAAILKGKTDNYIVIGAHYDHLGMGGHKSGSRMPDTVAVHNGADDNASGVAVMIECARILSQTQSDCGFIFVAFSAEEQGLVGSRYFVENLPVDKNAIKAMINFDMVGRLDNVLTIHGSGTAKEFDTMLSHVQKKYPFQLQLNPSGYGPSDHTSFYAERIPVLYFHTAIHEQYHTPFDDVELINAKGVDIIVDFATAIIGQLDETPKLTYLETEDNPTNMRSEMKVTLGIMPDHNGNVEGLRILSVKSGRAAERSGLQKGDIITAIQGEKVTGIESYMKAMSKFNKGDIVVIDVLRADQKIIVNAYL